MMNGTEMPNKMERFTQQAQRVLSLAETEAEKRHHPHIEPEHLLTALMREGGGVAGHTLHALGIELGRLEALVDELKPAAAQAPGATLDVSPHTKHVLELAVDEARRMGHHYIGTEHLLLGLVRQAENTVIEILNRFDVTPELVRRQTRKVMQESPTQTSQSAPVQVNPSQPAQIRTAKNPTFQVNVIDTPTGNIKFTLTLPFEEIEAIVDAVCQLIDNGHTGKVKVDDPDHGQRIEIVIKSDEEATAGDNDAK
jgi:ATP-dependent Clp protease ATP-binding subunit ClpC